MRRPLILIFCVVILICFCLGGCQILTSKGKGESEAQKKLGQEIGKRITYFQNLCLEGSRFGGNQLPLDSKIDKNAVYASEEEALMAGRDKVKGIVLSILDLITDKLPNGWTSQEGGKFPPIEVPIKIWDTFFHYLFQVRYKRLNEPTKEIFITERGMNWRTQLEEEVRLHS